MPFENTHGSDNEELSWSDCKALESAEYLFSRYKYSLDTDFYGKVSSLWDAVQIPFANEADASLNGDNIQVRFTADEHCETLYAERTFWIDRFKEFSQPSSFGHGSETKLDPSVRACLEIPGNRLRVRNLPDLDNLLTRFMLKPRRDVTLHLHKMLLYERGGHFAEHVDSLHRPGHIASLLVYLPTGIGFSGGSLTVRRGDSKPFVWNATRDSVDAVVFFTDCPHQVTPVTEGHRLILQYDVCVSRDVEPKVPTPYVVKSILNLAKESNAPPPTISSSTTPQALGEHLKNADPADLELLNRFQDDSGRIQQIIAEWKELLAENQQKQYGLVLKHKYAKADIVPSMLKGADLKLYEELQNESSLKVRLCSLVLHTIRNIDDHDRTDTDIEAYVWQQKNSKIDHERAVLNIPMFPSGIQWRFREGEEYTGNEAFAEEGHYLSAALFVELRGDQEELDALEGSEGS